ncbi:metabotropic glutamate receptor 8-like [Harmonia axyridis]|uniref:metabotropic glutamate receptor 8-like n=1 Tax=Harmonia axyridis TaxID=115357 RepID=UPI001E2751B1|nr:metabotropic glutamate receptor 8-like [Harmonia axyridis]
MLSSTRKTFFILYLLISSRAAVDERKLIRVRGDIIFGGIFPLHEQIRAPFKIPCGAVKEEKGIQRLEAMLFAIDEINESYDLLPNVTLGALIIDSCSSDTYALEQSMEFVRSYMNQDMSENLCENGKPPVYVPHKPVTAVIGASFSVVSIMVANILRLFERPPDLMEDIPLSQLQGIWYQHDGCPAHTVRSVREFLHSKLPQRWIESTRFSLNQTPSTLDSIFTSHEQMLTVPQFHPPVAKSDNVVLTASVQVSRLISVHSLEPRELLTESQILRALLRI